MGWCGCSSGFEFEEVRWTEGAGYEHLRRCEKVNAVRDAAMSAYVDVGWCYRAGTQLEMAGLGWPLH